MSDAAGQHIPVMSAEVLEWLAPQPGQTVLDATVGEGGHLAAICRALGDASRLIGMDADPDALAHTCDRFRALSCDPTLIQSNFRYLRRVLREHGIDRLDRVLFDLGMSSYQIDASGRGFSFRRDEPLDMSLDPDSGRSARQIVNQCREHELARILRTYGQERFAKRIARAIVDRRKDTPIESTAQLREVIEGAVPAFYTRQRLHPATRSFQALRIAVNDELAAINEGLSDAFELLAPGGRLVAISFHSLEDRAVKDVLQRLERDDRGVRLSRKAIHPDEAERERNPRSRSAQLRVFQKAL